MCGVHGMLTADTAPVARMTAACRHRGPDGQAVRSVGPYVFGHNLLAVRAAVVESVQPWQDEHGWLSYNGEIYDFGALPEVPGQSGDTPRLAHALGRYGCKTLAVVDGMYALAHYSPARGELLLARDPTGAKPLYYTEVGPLRFSSELRGLLAAGVRPRLDPLGLRLYLQFGFIPGPRTLLAGVRKLVPGEYRVYRAPVPHGSGNPTAVLQSSGNLCRSVPEVPFDPAVYRDKLIESVRRCLVSQRPFGLYLSGGMDSCSVLWAMRELGVRPQTMSMRFTKAREKQALLDGDCDIAARFAAACGATHTEMLFTEQDYLDHLEDAFACDEPISRKGMPAYLAAHNRARELGWVVAFTGDGGDELLSGYGRHVRLLDPRYRTARLPGDALARWQHLHSHGGHEKSWLHAPARQFDVITYLRSWVPAKLLTGDVLRDELALEGICHLAEDFLIRSDKLGMSQGLECRFPLLHEPFRSYALGLPSKIKLAGWTLKHCAREAMRGHLPDEVVDKPKSGWGPPTGAWLDGKHTMTGPLGDAFRRVLRPGRVPALDALIDVERVKGRVKVALALFHLLLWAERIGLEA